MAAQHLDTGRHRSLTQACLNGIIGDFIAVLPPERQCNLHRHSGMVGLVFSGKRQLDAVAAIVDIVFQRTALEELQVLKVRCNNGGMRLGSRIEQRPHHFFRLFGIAHNSTAFLDNTCLFGGDFRQSFPEDFGMIKANTSNCSHKG